MAIPPGWHERSSLHYARQGTVARLKTEGLVNHETRDIIVGLWARLDAADRADLIRELQAYDGAGPGYLGAIASAFSRALAGAGESVVDLLAAPVRRLPL